MTNRTYIIAITIVVILIIVCLMQSCQRTDYELYHPNTDLIKLRVSSTSIATDSKSSLIEIDPNGTVWIEGYEKKEDSLKVKANPIIHQVRS